MPATTRRTTTGAPTTPTRTAQTKRPKPQPSAKPRGQIIPKGASKYLVRVAIGRDERTGKRLTTAQTVDGTRSDANKALTALLAQVDSGKYRPAVRSTLGDYLTGTWLADCRAKVKTGALSACSLDDYSRAVRKLVEHFGALSLSAITKQEVANVRRTLVERYAPKAAQRTFDVFRMALRQAWKLDVIPDNPAPAVERIKTAPPKTAVLTPEQVSAFLTETEDYRHGRYAALFHVLLLGGLRPGEAAALAWADLSGNARDGYTLQVERAVTEDVDGKRIVGPTKTRKARGVALPAEAVAALDRHRRWQTATVMRRGARATWADAGAPMFTGDDGKPLTVQRIRAAWNTIRRRAKLPAVRLYDCRHTYATTLLHAGVDARTVADQMGHADPAMTLRRYAHATPASKQDAAAKLSAALAAVALPLRRSA